MRQVKLCTTFRLLNNAGQAVLCAGLEGVKCIAVILLTGFVLSTCDAARPLPALCSALLGAQFLQTMRARPGRG